MTNWVYNLGIAIDVAGNFGDEIEVKLLRGCWSKSFDDLECSDMFGYADQLRWKRLDFALEVTARDDQGKWRAVIRRCDSQGT